MPLFGGWRWYRWHILIGVSQIWIFSPWYVYCGLVIRINDWRIGVDRFGIFNWVSRHRSLILSCSPLMFALNAESSGEFLAVGVLITHNLFCVSVRDLDVCMAQACGQVSDRCTTSHHTHCERMAERMDLTRL